VARKGHKVRMADDLTLLTTDKAFEAQATVPENYWSV
jgi:hypothetical protein